MQSETQNFHAFSQECWSKLAKAEFSKDKRPSQYKAWSEVTVILSIQDVGLMLFGVTRWFAVNLTFGVMIPLVQDLHIQWRFAILSIQDLNLTWFFRRPSRYKVWSEDTVIFSIQDPGLMFTSRKISFNVYFLWRLKR